MKKLCLAFLTLILTSSCVSMQAYQDLSSRVQQLETKSKPSLQEAMLLAEQTGTNRFWWRNDVIGGGTALDGINHASLTDGDCALVGILSGTSGYGSWWIYDSDGTNSDDPGSCTDDTCTRVAPNSGGGAWYRITFMPGGLSAVAADGYHYWDASNTDDLAVGSRVDGRCWYSKTDNRLECYDGSNIQYWTASGTE